MSGLICVLEFMDKLKVIGELLIKHDYRYEYNFCAFGFIGIYRIIVTQVMPGQVEQLQQLRDGQTITC